jgi:hypothetical protein
MCGKVDHPDKPGDDDGGMGSKDDGAVSHGTLPLKGRQ